MPFALDSNPSVSEVSEAINYLLGNFGANISADPNTGQIIGPTGQVSGYLYKYMAVKYADSFDGSVNFSNSPTNRLYFGVRNNNDAAESSNPADYIWYEAAGGFGLTKSLWYVSTGGRQIQFEVAVSAPDAGWLIDPGSSIDLDVVTSGNIPVIAEAFIPYFTPNTLQVPRSGTPLAPVFTNITPVMYATDAGAVVPFSDAQTDTAVNFVNGTWRIGNSSITGNADISYTNITIGSPTDAGDYAQWPNPTAMSASPAYITVPVRYKNNLGVVAQAGVATVQLVFTDPGAAGDDGPPGPTVDINGYTAFVQNAAGAFSPSTATLTAVTTNVTAPTYSWTISGATPTTSTTASVVVTPTSSSTGVNVSLTVNGSNLIAPITKTMQMPVVYDGAAGEAGANGLMSAFPSIYIWTGSSTPPTRPSTTSTYTWSSGAYTAPSGWATQPPTNTTAGNYLWIITIPLTVSATTTTSTLDWTNVTYPIRAIAYNGANGEDGTNGLNGTRTAILDVYQWSVSAPTTFPTGSSTYTWATGQFTAPAVLNGWSLTPPASVLGQTLWIARQLYADTNSTATSSVTWSASTATPAGASGTNGAPGDPGVNGTRTAFLEVYQWAATAPTSFPSGTSTYTWANGSFTAPTTPNGWSLIPGASTPGYTLYGCSVRYADILTTSTTSVTWSTSTAYIVGAAGANGADGTDGLNGAPGAAGSATFVITRAANDSSAPTNAEVSALLGRNPVAGDICTISYNTANNAVVYRFITSWALFQTYITGSLIVQNTITGDKVAANTITGSKIAGATITADKLSVTELAAVSASTGNLTVTGNFQSNNAAISGTTMTGSGGILYSSGNFALGNTTTNISFNGTQMTLNGNVVATENINLNAVTLASSAFTSATYRNTANATWQDAQTLTITTSGKQVYATSSGLSENGLADSGGSTEPIIPKFRLVRDSTVLMTVGSQPAMSFSDTPAAGTYTYRLQVYSEIPAGASGVISWAGISSRSLFAIETKR